MKKIAVSPNIFSFRKKAKEKLKEICPNIKHVAMVELKNENGYSIFVYGVNMYSLKPCGVLLSYNGKERITKYKAAGKNYVEAEMVIKK